MDRQAADGLYAYLKMKVSCEVGDDDYEPDKDVEYMHSFLRAVFDANYKQQLEEYEAR